MRELLRFAALIVTLAVSTGASAGYSSLFIFGDSLSDTGNNAFVFDLVGESQGIPPGTLRTPVPTANNSFIPDFPYATSVGGRYSNGPVWPNPSRHHLDSVRRPRTSAGPTTPTAAR